MKERLAGKQVVLLGIGHTNAHVVRMWRMNRPVNAQLTCLSNYSYATYSGMLPALLAGQISPADMEINLAALCNAAEARLITDAVIGIDHVARELQFANRPPVPFDVLSIGIGSIASTEGLVNESSNLVPIKPMQSFLQRLAASLDHALHRRNGGQISVVIVGSGVAGIEITSCLPNFLAKHGIVDYRLGMVTRSDVILPDVRPKTRNLVLDVWRSRGIEVVTGSAVRRLSDSTIELDSGDTLDADVVIWATGASAPPLLSQLDLKLDDRGFIATNRCLESVEQSHVFAVGDTGTIEGESLPKAGVYAVRQGPILWDNILRALDGRPLREYNPQTNFLKLINLGDGRAIGQWKGLSFRGRWVMRLKDRIDVQFMEKFIVKPMKENTNGTGEMQCRGCGCKLGAASLRDALAVTTDVETEDAVVIGRDVSGDHLIASTDFFSAPLNDAFTVGRIAALHSASDIVASGAVVTEALANLVIPEGDAKSQQREVADLLAGAKKEFSAWDASIVGGHTIVGPRMEVGFTVIGQRIGPSLLRKSKMRVGDQLILTKAIGIGVLLAAHMRSQCPARAYDTLLQAMLQPQHLYMEAAVGFGAEAATDVTGFGLVGHLLEMAESSRLTARIHMGRVATLPSAIELTVSGIESTLLPDNLMAQRSVQTEIDRSDPKFRLLFDPQTCGGLLIAMDAEKVTEFQRKLQSLGLEPAFVIGEVVEQQSLPIEILG